MSIYVNRILNLRRIKAIGFDMDYTLVRYNSKAFEQLTYEEVVRKLVKTKKYPRSISKLKFKFDKAIRGLVVDKANGNLLKLNMHGKIKLCYHGLKLVRHNDTIDIYRGMIIDLNESIYSSIDTTFSIAFAVLYAQLVELKDNTKGIKLPSYEKMADDVLEMVDVSHRDGSLKTIIRENLKKYIVKDANTVKSLERMRKYGKKLWVITNSDFHYTKALLDYTITPYLKKGETWADLFDIVVTSAQKPRFFTEATPFQEVELETGKLKDTVGPFQKGIFQGGCATAIQNDNKLDGEEILYLGDHIYGDILKLKKACNWRTALVIDELEHETLAIKKAGPISKEIDKLMKKKTALERKIDQFYIKEMDAKKKPNRKLLDKPFKQIEDIDRQLSKLIQTYQKLFNPRWGEVMRAGQDPSYFSSQVDRYACIYMSKVSDMVNYSPRSYFRPRKRQMAHDF